MIAIRGSIVSFKFDPEGIMKEELVTNFRNGPSLTLTAQITFSQRGSYILSKADWVFDVLDWSF